MKRQAEIGGTPGGGLNRLTLTEEDRAVRDWFRDLMTAADLSVRVDEMGNMFGRREGTDPEAAPVLVGSHLDSQPHGGIYDGALGVLAALELIETLEDNGIRTTHPIEIVNWTNEEGTRFSQALQGSGVWSGVLDRDEQYELTDDEGVRFVDALEEIGYRGEVPCEPAERYEAFLELHVEQGTYLDSSDNHVGVVNGIVGISRGSLTFRGEADHAGPTPMHHRRDALVPAADVVTYLRRLAGTLGERTVATAGRLDVERNVGNIIPDEVTMTWDIRDSSDDILKEGLERILAQAECAARREGVEWAYDEHVRLDSVSFADECIDAIAEAAADLGYESMSLTGGAGHDASFVANVCPAAMVFAVSEDGKSHVESEYTSWEDCYRAANTLANAAVSLANR